VSGAIPDGWAALRAYTAARIALGRCGAGLPTKAALEFGLAHALARDAVHAPFETQALQCRLEADGWTTLRLRSCAPDRASYLQRPDLGRSPDEDGARLLARGVPPKDGRPRLALVLADGLSARAAWHALPLLRALRPLLGHWAIAPVVLAEQARVALGDPVGAALEADAVVVMLGERPGLSAPDSLGLYLTWAPRPGRTDAERNCISNVRPQGVGPDLAADRLAWLLESARRLGASGVKLKDDSAVPGLLGTCDSGVPASTRPIPVPADRGGET
jgi:ethanolamine ammonia-lyase small subunit